MRNVTRSKEDAPNNTFFQSDVDNLNEDVDTENYQPNIFDKPQYSEFDFYKDRIEKFEKELCLSHLKDDKNSFYYSILLAVRFHIIGKKITVMKLKLWLLFELIYI